MLFPRRYHLVIKRVFMKTSLAHRTVKLEDPRPRKLVLYIAFQGIMGSQVVPKISI